MRRARGGTCGVAIAPRHFPESSPARKTPGSSSDAKATAAIRRNLEKTRLTGKIHEMDIFSYLDRLAGEAAFDLILADPPYAKQKDDRDFTAELLASEGLRKTLDPDGFFVLEHRPGAHLPVGEYWECIRQKRYGATEVALLRRNS